MIEVVHSAIQIFLTVSKIEVSKQWRNKGVRRPFKKNFCAPLYGIF